MSLPSGIIIIWSGAIIDIPAGYVICDGNNGTPNLQNRFVPGAGDSYAVGASGGLASHAHSFVSDGHTHDLPGGPELASGANFSTTTTSEVATGDTDTENNLPPYYALAFIMKT